eukprot:COSAG06_NODE_1046_length_10974_cov_9.971405_9_plen_793_part_01
MPSLRLQRLWRRAATATRADGSRILTRDDERPLEQESRRGPSRETVQALPQVHFWRVAFFRGGDHDAMGGRSMAPGAAALRLMLLLLLLLLAPGARAQTCEAPASCGLAELPQAKLTADDAAATDYFGCSVAIAAGVAIVGARLDDDAGTNSGAAYIFAQDGGSGGGTWSQVAKLRADDAAAGDEFGVSVAIAAGVAIVGAQLDDDGGSDSGSAYIFAEEGGSGSGTWTQVAKLRADDAAASHIFGLSVAIAAGVAIVGAPGDADGGSASGAAYIFAQEGGSGGGTWSQVAKLRADDAAATDYFGSSVAIAAGVAIVGAKWDDDAGSNSGSAYIFAEEGGSGGGTWSQVAKLRADDAAAEDYFGSSVAIAAGVAIVGAYRDDDGGTDSGAAYIFAQAGGSGGGTWSQVAKLRADDAAAGDEFGFSVAIAAGVAIVGARYDDDGGSMSGSAYIFAEAGGSGGGTWSQVAKLRADDAAASDFFGLSVAIAAGVAIVGAYRDDDGGSDSGSAHVFECCSSVPTCTVPTTPLAGYDLDGVACSGLSTGTIVCEVDPACAVGYHGAPAESDYSCDANGAELTIGGCTANTCVLPITAVVGYDLTGVACSNLQTGSIACDPDPTCATGYTGTPAESDYSCDANGAELTIGGCTANACVLPTTAVAGYDLTAVACSDLQTGSIACDPDPTCATGYTGTPAESDYSCDANGAELTIGGCTLQTCDVGVVTQPINGQFGSTCAVVSTTIDHGTSCDLTCDTGLFPSAQPSCVAGVLSSTTATCTSCNDAFAAIPSVSSCSSC